MRREAALLPEFKEGADAHYSGSIPGRLGDDLFKPASNQFLIFPSL
jgi:hypothetical protein